MPLYIAFIDLTKVFDLVSRDGFYKVLPKIGCPPKLQSMIESFHTGTKGTVQFNGSSSTPFQIRSGVKQGCVLAPALFGILFWPVAKTCLQHNNRRNLTSYPLGWQALQPRPSQSQDKCLMYARYSSGTCCLLMTHQLRPTPILKGHCIEFKYYADGIHSGLTPPG